MREIKFRAWDKDNKIMWQQLESITLNLMGGVRYITPLNNKDPLNYVEKPIENEAKCLQLMQYTGLRDKNGKEIYNGDILSYELRQGWEIFFEDGCYYMMRDGHSFLLEKVRAQTSEIIGNIYENPELLKENNEKKST